MKNKSILGAILIVPLLFTMCSNKGNIPIESNWMVESIYSDKTEIPVPEDHNATLAFLKGSKTAGSTGCNRFFGDFQTKGKELHFVNIGATRMMCPQMQFENLFMEVLSNTDSFSISKDKMALMDQNGNIIMVLCKIAPTASEN